MRTWIEVIHLVDQLQHCSLHFVISTSTVVKPGVRPGQFQTGPLGLGLAIEESLGSPAKQEQGSQSDRVRTENKRQYSPGNTQNGVLSRAGLM